MNRFLVWVTFFAILPSIGLSQRFRSKQKTLGIPYFQVIVPGYPTANPDSVRIDVIARVPFDAIQFLKKEGTFEAQFELSIDILNEDEKKVSGKISSYSVNSNEFRQTISPKSYELVRESFVVATGEYSCEMSVTDKDTHKSGHQTIKLDLMRFGEGVALSDLLLIDPQDMSDLSAGGIPRIPYHLTGTDTVFYLYYEARVTPGEFELTVDMITVDDESLSNETLTRSSGEGVMREILKLLRPASAGNKFKIQLSLAQGEEKSTTDIVVESRWRGLTSRVSNMEDAIEQVRYIATSKEYKKLRKAKKDKKEQFFKEFWQNRDPSPETPENELMDEYYRRVQYCNNKFGSWQNGWKTPMGMIFILFGPPDDIEINLHARDGRSYQRWHYYAISRSFLFVDFNGFGDYELVEPYNSPYGTRRF